MTLQLVFAVIARVVNTLFQALKNALIALLDIIQVLIVEYALFALEDKFHRMITQHVFPAALENSQSREIQFVHHVHKATFLRQQVVNARSALLEKLRMRMHLAAQNAHQGRTVSLERFFARSAMVESIPQILMVLIAVVNVHQD